MSCNDNDQSRIDIRLRTRYLDQRAETLDQALQMIDEACANGEALSVGLLGNGGEILPELVRRGVSKTMESRHVTGHAVDLVPYINRKLRWEWEPIYVIADAVRTAARELDTPIRWGGAWDRLLTELDDTPEDIVQDYAERRRAQGRRPFLDGPHYELPRNPGSG